MKTHRRGILQVNILFICVANSARSQMAEGLARSIWGDLVQVRSAGSAPGVLNPFAVKVMNEVGIDISNHHSKGFNEIPPDFYENLKYLISMCDDETVCPILATHAKKLHWGLPDPAREGRTDEERLTAFRRTRDEIRRRLETFKGF